MNNRARKKALNKKFKVRLKRVRSNVIPWCLDLSTRRRINDEQISVLLSATKGPSEIVVFDSSSIEATRAAMDVH